MFLCGEMKTNRTTTMKPVLHSLLIAWTTYANKLQSGCRVTGRTVSAPVVYRALMQVCLKIQSSLQESVSEILAVGIPCDTFTKIANSAKVETRFGFRDLPTRMVP